MACTRPHGPLAVSSVAPDPVASEEVARGTRGRRAGAGHLATERGLWRWGRKAQRGWRRCAVCIYTHIATCSHAVKRYLFCSRGGRPPTGFDVLPVEDRQLLQEQAFFATRAPGYCMTKSDSLRSVVRRSRAPFNRSAFSNYEYMLLLSHVLNRSRMYVYVCVQYL